jgi:hypothetical protein
MDWQLHWLEAEGDLNTWREQIATEVAATYTIVSCLITPPRLDILVQRGSMVIAEIGMVGQAYRKGLFALTLDPDNPHFTVCLGDGTLRRQATHEVHHCLRMGGPGYGRTLGEALVSEGLAGHSHRMKPAYRTHNEPAPEKAKDHLPAGRQRKTEEACNPDQPPAAENRPRFVGDDMERQTLVTPEPIVATDHASCHGSSSILIGTLARPIRRLRCPPPRLSMPDC